MKINDTYPGGSFILGHGTRNHMTLGSTRH
jgi:hypothetical protein